MSDIQIYATETNIEATGDTMNVTLRGVDSSQVISQFSLDEIIDSLDFTPLADNILARLAEDRDE